jgi:glycosyltransferase involved in cell wall biosynthesis
MGELKGKKYQLVIEFYTIGSVLGQQLKNEWGAQLIIIYDSPVLEQFREMYHTRTIFDHRIEKAEKESIQTADCVVCYSSFVSSYIREKYGFDVSFYIMPCIVWKNVQSGKKENQDEITIGFVGSFLSWHKVPMLLLAFENIAEEFENSRLVLVGYGEEWPLVNRLREKSIYRDRILLTGYVSEKQLEELKLTFTIAVMPGSNWYGSPLKLFEYAQSRIPMIAPSTPVVKDLFRDKETALLIAEKNELSSLVKNIKLLINDKVLAATISDNAFSLMNGVYSREQQMNNFINFVKKMNLDGIKG